MLVGAGGYQWFRQLKFAAFDAADFATALREHLGFTQETMLLLTDVDDHEPVFAPTRNAILHTLSMLGNADSKFYSDRAVAPIDEEDLFLFYFSGHGVCTADGEEFLLPLDASDQDVPVTGLDLDDLMQRISKLPCKHKVLFLDACRSELEDEEGAKGANGSKGVGTNRLKRPGLATFYSCDPRKRSYEIDDEDIKHGSFTHCLLAAVEDPEVKTLGELNSYLVSRVPRLNAARKKRPQQPFFVPEPVDMSDLDLFALRRRRVDVNELKEQVARLATDEVIDLDWWEKIASFLNELEEGRAENAVLRRKILADFLGNPKAVDQFKGRWALTEKGTSSVREDKPQVLPPPEPDE